MFSSVCSIFSWVPCPRNVLCCISLIRQRTWKCRSLRLKKAQANQLLEVSLWNTHTHPFCLWECNKEAVSFYFACIDQDYPPPIKAANMIWNTLSRQIVLPLPLEENNHVDSMTGSSFWRWIQVTLPMLNKWSSANYIPFMVLDYPSLGILATWFFKNEGAFSQIYYHLHFWEFLSKKIHISLNHKPCSEVQT